MVCLEINVDLFRNPDLFRNQCCTVLHHSELVSFNSGLSNAKYWYQSLVMKNGKISISPKKPCWPSSSCNTQGKISG